MTKNLSHITSYDGLALFHDPKEEQIPEISKISKISNRTNKKRKKDNTSELRNSAKKKTKAIQDDNNDKKYFLTSKNINNWYNSLNKVKKYINNEKKRPSIHDKDKEIQKLGRWISLQQANYIRRNEAMKDENIYSKWSQFMIEYQEYFLISKNINKWYENLNKVKKYIDNKKIRPTESDKDDEIQKLGKWISLQQSNYNKKKEAMKDENIYSKWSQFMIEYQEYFLTIHDKWYNSLNKVKKYIDDNGKKPTISDKDKEIKKLGRWISLQQANYKKRKKVFIDDKICYKWSQFMKDYQQYFSNTCDICGKKDHETINCFEFLFH